MAIPEEQVPALERGGLLLLAEQRVHEALDRFLEPEPLASAQAG